MDNPLDQTTLSTISLLESRLLRLEQLLHGSSTPPPAVDNQHVSAQQRMGDLEKRFSMLTSRIRVYGDLLKICASHSEHIFQPKKLPSANHSTDKAHPDFFHSPNPSDPPSQLSPEAIQSIVLASASAFPATSSSLTAINDSPIPDPADSAALIALTDRMKAIEATQLAQAAEMANLRKRSEIALRTWYESGVLERSNFVASMESRVSEVDRQIRRKEHNIERAKEI